MRLRAWADGRIHLTVLTVDHGGKATEAYQEWVVREPTRRPGDQDAD
jgi:hypothetical protein